jgi:hypothetical protein
MNPQIRYHKIAIIAGDGEYTLSPIHCTDNLSLGIGIEVTASALEVLRKVQAKIGGFQLDFDELDYGSK